MSLDGGELDFVRRGVNLPCGCLGGALEGEGSWLALSEGSGDDVAVGGELAFVGDVEGVYGEFYGAVAERHRRDRHPVGGLVDAVESALQGGPFTFFDLQDDAEFLFVCIECSLPVAGEVLRVEQREGEEKYCCGPQGACFVTVHRRSPDWIRALASHLRTGARQQVVDVDAREQPDRAAAGSWTVLLYGVAIVDRWGRPDFGWM